MINVRLGVIRQTAPKMQKHFKWETGPYAQTNVTRYDINV